MSSRQLIKGTLILTIAGIITRILGFFYRIYLSNIIGAANLGIYQLVFPVYAICHTIFASGIQTSLSKIVAAQPDKSHALKYLYHGIILSIIPATILSYILYANAPFVANRILMEPDSINCIRYISLIFPVCTFTSCINGYYYGLKNTIVPSLSQLTEQFSRIILIFVLLHFNILSEAMGCMIAIWGLIIGEIFSCVFNVVSILGTGSPFTKPCRHCFSDILKPAIPLTLNRLFVNVLSSIESTLVPFMLRTIGLSSGLALSIYGTLSGMSIPFIMFPSTISGSFSVMLLPEISQDSANNRTSSIQKTTIGVISLSSVIGFISTAVFYYFGNELGILIFSSVEAGRYISMLSFVCPFIYISTTFSSILNGLNKTTTVLINSVSGIIARIFLLVFLMRQFGINGYIASLIISQVLLTALDYIALIRCISFRISITGTFVIPILLSVISIWPTKKLYTLLMSNISVNKIYSIIILFSFILFGTAIYLLLVLKKCRHKFIGSIRKCDSSV